MLRSATFRRRQRLNESIPQPDREIKKRGSHPALQSDGCQIQISNHHLLRCTALLETCPKNPSSPVAGFVARSTLVSPGLQLAEPMTMTISAGTPGDAHGRPTSTKPIGLVTPTRVVVRNWCGGCGAVVEGKMKTDETGDS